jgi:uncharacterized repeat protein (TIGR01451 family)
MALGAVFFATPTANADAHLSLDIEHVGFVEAGRDATYRLTVGNTGSEALPSVTVQAELPEGLTFASGGGDSWQCTAADALVTCALNSELSAGAEESTDLTVAVQRGAPRVITLEAIAAAGEYTATATDVVVVTEVLGEKIAREDPASSKSKAGFPATTAAVLLAAVLLTAAAVTWRLARARGREQ